MPRSPKRQRTSLAHRALSILFSLLLGLFGALLVWTPFAAHVSQPKPLLGACMLVFVGGFISLFSLGYIWQTFRDQPTERSFFIRWLVALGSKSSPAHILLVLLALELAAFAFGLLIWSPVEMLFDAKLLSMWLAFHLQIFWHEYGHWAAARACHYRPYRVVGGAIALRRNAEGRWTVRLNRDWQFLLGGAVFYNVSDRIRTRARDATVIAAGPFATAALGLLCSELLPFAYGVPVLSELVELNITLSVVLFVYNLLPFRMSTGLASDGHQLLRLWRRRA